MEKTIYRTNEYSGHGKQNYYCYKYTSDGEKVYKYKCHRRKFFDGDENRWDTEERLECSWDLDDSDMPEWISNYL